MKHSAYRLYLLITWFFAALVLTACGGKDPTPVETSAPAAAQADDAMPTEPASDAASAVPSAPDLTLPPERSEIAFNRRATGSGTAVVEGVPYAFEVYLCGAPVTWNDKAYPEGSEETAFYVDPGGAELEILDISGAGTQEDGAIFEIRVDLDRRSGLVDASISHIVRGDPSQSWSYYSGLNSPQRLEFDPPCFKSVDGGLTFFNEEDPIRPIRLSFEATCETYGGTFDTMGELAAEVTGVTLPGSGAGGFVLDDEPFAFEPETCLLDPERGAALIEGEGERFSFSVDLQSRDGPLFIALNLYDPPRNLGLLTFDEIPLIVEGARLYNPQPFTLTRGTHDPVSFSLDITCPEIGG